jgi:glycosyltransferase involved in cell wall biosynthesis
VAQFIGRKGHRFLIRAVPEILRAHPGTIFLFLGKGPLENQLRKECSKAGISDRVLFAGFREDLHLILPCLDILIHPALMEGLGVALLQAAAAGVPIIGTRVGGIPEVVLDESSGILIPPEDSAAIARAALRLLTEPALARRMGSEGRRIARERFSIEAMVKGNLAVYREMMGKES